MEVAALSALGRPLTLIAESDLNDPTLITAARRARLRPRRTVERRLPSRRARRCHRRDDGATTPTSSRSAPWAKVLERGFFHDGTYSSFPRPQPRRARSTRRDPRPRASSSAARTTTRSATGPTGDRIGAMVDADHLAVAAVLTLTSPFTPMLFMGEEWGASTPWQFFTAHPEPELGRATAEGRIKEFERMGGSRGRARSAGSADLRAFQVELGRAGRARCTPGCWRCTPNSSRCAARVPDLTDPRFIRLVASATSWRKTLVIERGCGDGGGRPRGGPAELPDARSSVLLVEPRRGGERRAAQPCGCPAAPLRSSSVSGQRRSNNTTTITMTRRRITPPPM